MVLRVSLFGAARNPIFSRDLNRIEDRNKEYGAVLRTMYIFLPMISSQCGLHITHQVWVGEVMTYVSTTTLKVPMPVRSEHILRFACKVE